MKILGWSDRVAISDQKVRQRWNDVAERWREKQGAAHFVGFASKVMQGKSIAFDGNTFSRLVRVLAPVYLNSKKETTEAFLGAAFNKAPDLPELEDPEVDLESLREQPLFKIEGKVWTVRDFQMELERHPLVFRKKRFGQREFPEQLKLAIVDAVRDRYLTEVAYQRGYDQELAVARNVELWQDAEVALYWKHRYLKQHGLATEEKNAMAVINQTLCPYVDSLQQKYSNDIQINVEAFDRIRLTRIDMFVQQNNVPFPVYVPAFPQLTTDHKLDYGRRISQDRNN